ncbi:MAG: hypothetical protein AAGD04_13710 [Pseudomonadota bacterium]
MTTTDLNDTRVTRRYFRKFDAITSHLARVAGMMEVEKQLSKADVKIMARYLLGLSFTFRALSHKYLFSGRMERAGHLTLDRSESGFPVFTEIMEMANDAAQAHRHLDGMPGQADLKSEMVRKILGDFEIPMKLQYAMSQRLYYEELAQNMLFWARNHPESLWIENRGDRRLFLVHWAVYDSETNLPQIYLMELEDSGKVALPKDERRWPEVQSHLMAQAVGGLKLLTIARGFDADFDDLHPKRLRRFHVGPMYSSAFTRQSGPLQRVLETARAPEGEDWALAWTQEDLQSERVAFEKAGWFSKVEREVFTLDPFEGQGGETGATSMDRALILPERPFQALQELSPPGFRDVRKFVVTPKGRVMSAW